MYMDTKWLGFLDKTPDKHLKPSSPKNQLLVIPIRFYKRSPFQYFCFYFLGQTGKCLVLSHPLDWCRRILNPFLFIRKN